MSRIVTISGSPSAGSTSDAVLSHVVRRLVGANHDVVPLTVRDLPAEALLSADITDPGIAGAVSAVEAADGIVIVSPIYQAAYSGLLKVFLDLLPQYAFRGKHILPLATAGSPAHVLALDYALRPVLTSLGASHISQGWLVLSTQVRQFDDGGVVIDPSAIAPLADVVGAFLVSLAQPIPAAPLPGVVGARVSATAGHHDLQVVRASVGDPVLEPLLADLKVEYGTRYGLPDAHNQLIEVPESDFDPPHGTFLALVEDGQTIAGGALRRYDEQTAEVKRVWTSHRHRRRGLALRLMSELERAALELGYTRIHLTTGPRQAEAKKLYLSAGYTPRFDVDGDPEQIGPLAFYKELVAGAGIPAWRQPTWEQVSERRAARVPAAAAQGAGDA